MTSQSMQDQVFKLQQEIIQLRAQNKQQMNYSMDLLDNTADFSMKGNRRISNTGSHKSQKLFSLSSNYHPKPNTKKPRASFSSLNNNYNNQKISSKGSSYSQSNNASKSTQLIKVPILRGMFSYKKTFIDDDKKSKFNLNSSLMSQDINLNFLDDDMKATSNNDGRFTDNISSNRKTHLRHHQSSTSIDLSKYKIISSQTSNSVIGLSRKNSVTQIMDPNSNKRNNNGNNCLIDSAYQPLLNNSTNNALRKFKIDELMLSPNSEQGNNNNYKQASSQMQMSPVIINNINLQSNSNSNDNNNYSKLNTTTTESFGFFKQKRKHERESRRMVIELVKLKQKSTKEPIDSILSSMNINNKVLEQEKRSIKVPQSSITNFLNNPNQKTPNYSQNTSMMLQNRTKSMSSLQQMHQFMSEMNDDNKEKINMINYLSVPRMMNMILNASSNNCSSVAYIFVLSPNSICHLYGIETYVFKWKEFKNGANFGYFDLLKVANCLKDKFNPNQFKIQIEEIDDSGNNNIKTYEIEAASAEVSKNYVDCLNYLSQLIKCKAFKRIGNFALKNNKD